MSDIANVNQLAYVGRKPGSRDSDSWYTPAVYCEAVRQALGGVIDLDPFSSELANRTVQAHRILTEADDALVCPWPQVRTAFMNPPYSAGLCGKAIARFVQEFRNGTFEEGIVLVNNATETRWFQQIARAASALCFTDHRIQFESLDGKRSSNNTRGQCFLYLGPNPAPFAQVMSFGLITYLTPQASDNDQLSLLGSDSKPGAAAQMAR